jgi:hypothetical protein
MKDTMKRVRRTKFACVASVTALFFILSGQAIVAQTYSGQSLSLTPPAPPNSTIKSDQENTPDDPRIAELVKNGISPIGNNARFTLPNGVVYSIVELDRVTGKVYLTSPDDKLQKVQVSGFDSGSLKFTLVPKMPEKKWWQFWK